MPGICIASWQSFKACLLEYKKRAELLDQPTSWKIILKPMTGNVVVPEVHAVVYMVLNEVLH